MTVTDLTAAPMRQRRNNWNNWVATHAQMRPEAVALRFMGQETTWSQLHERAERLAAALHRRGVRAGDRVITLTLNRPEFFESVLAINARGALAVRVHCRPPPPELGCSVGDCGAVAALTEPARARRLGAVRAQVPAVKLAVCMDAETEGDVRGYEELVAEDGEPYPPVD